MDPHDRWRDRWRRRNEPQLVRAMFWQGIRHGTILVRAVVLLFLAAIITVIAWQSLQ